MLLKLLSKHNVVYVIIRPYKNDKMSGVKKAFRQKTLIVLSNLLHYESGSDEVPLWRPSPSKKIMTQGVTY